MEGRPRQSEANLFFFIVIASIAAYVAFDQKLDSHVPDLEPCICVGMGLLAIPMIPLFVSLLNDARGLPCWMRRLLKRIGIPFLLGILLAQLIMLLGSFGHPRSFVFTAVVLQLFVLLNVRSE